MSGDAPRLRGREAETAAVVDALVAGRALAVVGPGGMGKTSVLLAAVHATGRRCRHGEALDLLRWRRHLALTRALGREPVGASADDLAADVAREVGDGVLVLDDLQWLDDDTWSVLPQLIPLVATVFGARPAEGVEPDAVARLRSLGVEVLELGPLDDGVAAEVVADADPTAAPARRRSVVSAAHGNPLLLTQLARGADDTLDGLVARRLGEMSTGGRRAAAVVALSTAPVPADALGPAVHELVARQLARVEGEVVEPCGDLVAEAIRRAVDDDLAREAHEHLAACAPDPATAARHWYALGETAKAHAAVTTACGTAPGTAEDAAHLALAARTAPPPERVRWTVEGARALLKVSDPSAASTLIDELVALDPTAVTDAELLLMRATARVQRGDIEGGVRDVDDLLDLDPIRPDVRTAALEVRTAAAVLLGQDGREELEEAARSVSDDDDAGAFRTRMLMGVVMLATGDPGWRDVLPGGIDEAYRRGEPADALTLSEVVGVGHLLHDELDRGFAVLSAGVARARSLGMEGFATNLALLATAQRALIEGPRDELLDELGRLTAAAEPSRHLGGALSIVAVGLADRGRLADAEAVLDSPVVSALTDPMGAQAMAWARSEVALARGEPAVALKAAQEAVALGNPAIVTHGLAAVTGRWAILAGAGEASLPEPTSVFPAMAHVGPEAAGVDALAAGDADAAVEAFDAAASAAHGRVRRSELRARWGLAEALRLAGRDGDARAVLQELEREAATEGFEPLLARVRRARRSLGDVSRVPAVVLESGLTEREVEVLRMVAKGATTPQIAAELHVAPSTVDGTVRSARRKLGARTRVEAAAQVAAWERDG